MELGAFCFKILGNSLFNLNMVYLRHYVIKLIRKIHIMRLKVQLKLQEEQFTGQKALVSQMIQKLQNLWQEVFQTVEMCILFQLSKESFHLIGMILQEVLGQDLAQIRRKLIWFAVCQKHHVYVHVKLQIRWQKTPVNV